MNPVLPMAANERINVEAVKKHRVVIFVAPPGGGKSTQLPQQLLRAGFEIVVTQPRVLAARSVAQRVAFEYGCGLGEEIGLQTSVDRKVGKDTVCLFVTDGLEKMHRLMGGRKNTVLVIDEVHERNIHIDILMGWAKLQLESNPDLKLVLMSATAEAERLAKFFDGAPIISVPGRQYEVTKLEPGEDEVSDIVNLLQAGHVVLSFQAGKGEIDEIIKAVKVKGVTAELLPCHGQLTPEEQAKCFESYPHGKLVVGTNAMQTSITIPDATAVVDSGMERRKELINGVEGLHLLPISQADSIQRIGRAGRTGPGVYIDRCPVPWNERRDFPVPEILRTKPDQAVIELAQAGYDMETFPFLDRPKLAEIQASKLTLRRLGYLDQSGAVTKSGRLVAGLPIDVQFARMILEAEKWGVVDDAVTIAAILQQGGLTAKVCGVCKSLEKRSCDCCYRLLAPEEMSSDVLAQLAVYQYAEGMDKRTMISYGIFAKAVFEARRVRKQLVSALKGKVTFGSNGKRDNILRAITAGTVEHVYTRQADVYVGASGTPRTITKQSVVKDGELLVGQPWDLGNSRGVKHYIQTVTQVDLSMLTDVASHLCEFRMGISPRYEEVYLFGQFLGAREVSHETQLKAEARWLRDHASDLYIQYFEQLKDELCDLLDWLDIEDDLIPATIPELELWIGEAKSIIAGTHEFVDSL